ncbi:MAG: NAD(P)H-hydrate dehydratase [Candidatus Kerfeldbacteria bacterium]|nr:NAD(P)H-hydrate dehydratase [Candidatus Kerfeldbacteria bacterium]
MYKSRPTSHKGDNGVLYVVAGSRQYHGSLWYVVELASQLVDLIYVETDVTNLPLLRQLKKIHPALIPVASRQRARYLGKSNCLLLGPGLGRSLASQQQVQRLLRHPCCPIKRVIDADALYYLTSKLITTNTVITPQAAEFRALFGKQSAAQASRHWPGIIVAKGPVDYVCQAGRCRRIVGGNAGLTKGGTGDVLAALIASLGCVVPMTTACVMATQAIKHTAQHLAKKFGTFYSTRQVIAQLPQVLAHFNELSK